MQLIFTRNDTKLTLTIFDAIEHKRTKRIFNLLKTSSRFSAAMQVNNSNVIQYHRYLKYFFYLCYVLIGK